MNFGFLCYGNKGVLNLEVSSTDRKVDEVIICQDYKSLCSYYRNTSSVLCCDSVFGFCLLFMFFFMIKICFYGDKAIVFF